MVLSYIRQNQYGRRLETSYLILSILSALRCDSATSDFVSASKWPNKRESVGTRSKISALLESEDENRDQIDSLLECINFYVSTKKSYRSPYLHYRIPNARILKSEIELELGTIRKQDPRIPASLRTTQSANNAYYPMIPRSHTNLIVLNKELSSKFMGRLVQLVEHIF